MPDLSGLTRPDAYTAFAAAEDDALTALRLAMGASYADSPGDATLLAALELATAFLERATGRVFLALTGRLALDGSGSYRQPLPLPVVSANQLEGGGVSELVIADVYADGTAEDLDDFIVNDGVGLAPEDPRDNPYIDARPGGALSSGTVVSRSPEAWLGRGAFPARPRVVHVTATWGYLDEQGATPQLARQALAKLTIRALVGNDDPDGLEDLHRGALVSEQTQGRSYTLGPRSGGGGITTDREIDLLLSALRRPPVAIVSSPPRRRGRRAYP